MSDGTPRSLTEQQEQRLSESEHYSNLAEAEQMVLLAFESNEGWKFDDEAKEHIEAAHDEIRQAMRLYEAAVALEVSSDAE